MLIMDKDTWTDSVRTEAHFFRILLSKYPKKCMIDIIIVHFLR